MSQFNFNFISVNSNITDNILVNILRPESYIFLMKQLAPPSGY